MDYSPNTPREISAMLDAVGVSSVDELFRDIPESLRAKKLRLPEGLSEQETVSRFQELSLRNGIQPVCFAGGGMYDHYIPAVVDALSGRPEFTTAYTPYQPECSQGTLQALFEYQTAVCRLTGMDASNASLYDGGTAVAEGVLMAARITGRSRVVVDGTVNPLYRAVLKTYLDNRSLDLVTIPPDRDATDREALKKSLDADTACVVLQNPNYYGTIDDSSDISRDAHANGTLVVVASYPVALGILKTPGDTGADIAVGDGQSLGQPLSFGGPTVGFIACRMNHVRNLPGRVIGETADLAGRRGFVLTLQAREQHIKRQKATSNICSNQSLCALRALIFLSAYGKEGFRELSRRNYELSEFAKKNLAKVRGVSVWNRGYTFNEFVLALPKKAEPVVKKMLSRGILPGIPVADGRERRDNLLLVAVTEKRSRDHIGRLAAALEKSLWK